MFEARDIDDMAHDADRLRGDRAELYDLVREERYARDHEQWDRLAACYTDDSRIRVTWFTGTGAAFAAASVAQVRGPSTGRHLIFPMDARVAGDRAVVESDAMIQVRMTKDGVEFDLETYCRFLSWARRTADGWRLVTFDCIYLKDTLRTVNPDQKLPLDWAEIAKLRPSYRFLDFLLSASGYPIDQNLAGIDRPETVAALYAEADGWLAGTLNTPANAMSGVIDVHAHVVPADFPVAPAHCCDHWPHMAHQDGGKADVMIGERLFRKIDSRSWDIAARIADMDAQDVLIQALSPMPELLSYWIGAADTLALARHVNGAIAAMVAARPDRFAGLGMVPLQDPEMAAGELARMKADGLAGVEIGSNIMGTSPGDPKFDPFYAEAERLGMAVFVHALHPTTNDRLVGPRPPLSAFIGFPSDVGFAAASFLTGRTLEKFPGLRLGFSHGGGTFAAILPRLHNGWSIAPELQKAIAAPRETARRMFYDNIVFDGGLLAHLIATFGDTQIFAGSDYPYVAGQDFPGRPFDGLAPESIERLRAGNARRFLGLR